MKGRPCGCTLGVGLPSPAFQPPWVARPVPASLLTFLEGVLGPYRQDAQGWKFPHPCLISERHGLFIVVFQVLVLIIVTALQKSNPSGLGRRS